MALADELQRMEIISRDKYQRDEISRLVDAKDEGEAVGLVKGEAIGLVKGEAMALAKGRAEKEAELRRVAQGLLEDGMDPEKIFQLTGVKLA